MSIVTGSVNIEIMRVITVRSALGLEIRTGMKRSNTGRASSVIANEITGNTRKGKRAAYDALDSFIVANGGTSRPLS